MKIVFECEDKVYNLNELKVGDTFILYDNLDEVYMKTDTKVVRLNDGRTMDFTGLTFFQKVDAELIVKGDF